MAARPSAREIGWARRRLHAKAVAIVALAVGSYWALVFADVGIVARLTAMLGLVIAITAIGTGIMHDANHGAFSSSRRVNQVVAYSSDLIGASSWVWRFKHNTLHHASTNVVGVDSDIEQNPFARLAPQQTWHPWHRYQHVYMWFLYGFLTAKWFVVSDAVALARGGFGEHRFPKRPTRLDVALLGVGKGVHLLWAVLIPLALHPWWAVLAFYVVASWLVGFLLAMVFQLAHCTDEVEFLPATSRREETFEARQLRTTADVRCRVPVVRSFVRWLAGGLDHQIEHHLAPRLPHTAYHQMAGRVQALCAERRVTYHLHQSVTAAVAAHARWLKEMGARPSELTRRPVQRVRTGHRRRVPA